MHSSGEDLIRALAVQEMTNRLYRQGWTGEQLRDFTSALKEDGAPVLRRFAGGALEEIEGTPLFAPMLELTAIRYALEQTRKGAAA